jgi:hypothetical protein
LPACPIILLLIGFNSLFRFFVDSHALLLLLVIFSWDIRAPPTQHHQLCYLLVAMLRGVRAEELYRGYAISGISRMHGHHLATSQPVPPVTCTAAPLFIDSFSKQLVVLLIIVFD